LIAVDDPAAVPTLYLQHLGRQPLLAKKEMHRHIVLVVQREGKQGEKNGCFQRPLKQPDEFLQVGSSGA